MGRRSIICWRTGTTPLDWAGATVAIVASGPSAMYANLELVRDRCKMIACNQSWRLAPWADVLYGSDGQFWFFNKGVPEFPGMKFTSSVIAGKQYKLEVLLTEGNNSGIRAMRLAEALGARRALLIGYDYHVNGGVHWHAPHGGQLRNPGQSEARMWRNEMDKAAFALDIINCTPGSALERFPKLSLDEALNAIDYRIPRGTDQPRHCAVPR